MDEKEIAYIIEHQKFRLSGFDYLGYTIFWALWTLMLVPWVFFGGIFVFICELPVLYVIFRILRRNRRFLCVATQFTKADNYKAVLDICQHQNKAVIQQYPDYIVCNIPGSAMRGLSVITLVPLDNAILINSKGSQLTSIAIVGNRKNIQKFTERLNQIMG